MDCGLTNEDEIQFSVYLKLQSKIAQYPAVMIHDNVQEDLQKSAVGLNEGTPVGLLAKLYPYQIVGYKWLKFVTDGGCGCILGDEMGLGKTLQVITLLLHHKQVNNGPSLVIAPVSLLENWRRELSRFAPDLSVLVNHGSDRTGRYTDLLKYNVNIISYDSAISDLSMLCMVQWDLVIIDEAQNIKNPTALRTRSIKMIPKDAGIAVTGTPFENHTSDIWSIIDFSMPGILGSIGAFKREYTDDIEGAQRIEPILSSLMLRRRVADVADDLPKKVIISQPLAMSDTEAHMYEAERLKILESCSGVSATLSTLVKLRMFCAHSFLLDRAIRYADPIIFSTKYMRLCEILEEIIANKEKAILFTSFTEMFNILERDISSRFGIPVMCINGSTAVPKRQPIIDAFGTICGSALLVLNPRAAGFGLNITAANHVIHYNLEWNPALEDQATARSFRRGQDKPVFVYRLFYINSVEQYVNDKIDNKRSISNVAVIGTTGEDDNRSDILAALMKSPIKAERKQNGL